MPIAWTETQMIFFHFKWKWEHETEHQAKAPARVGLACRAQLVHTRHNTSKKRAQEGLGCYTGEGESKQGDRTMGLWWKGRGYWKEKTGKKLLIAPGSPMVPGLPRRDSPASTTERHISYLSCAGATTRNCSCTVSEKVSVNEQLLWIKVSDLILVLGPQGR